ncbi:MAG: hypothetical protein ABIN69_04200 [Aestuariivirga sp.]|jgi:hypothetical protein
MTDDIEIVDPMLIRMARSIATSQGSTDWRAFVPMATASLQALREPSYEMLEAAMPGMPDWGDLPEDWRKMIDHVLGESSEFNDNSHALRQKRAI